MSKKNTILIVIVLVLIVLLGAWAYKVKGGTEYSIVYLTTGEVYIGRLTTFPDLQLKDSYIFLATKDPADASKNNFQLNPIKDALWAPKSLHLVKDNVIFYGPLISDSKIAQTLAQQAKD